MKKILNILVVFSLVLIYSCEYNNSDFNTDDQLTGTAIEGAAIVAVNTSSDGKLLGSPSSSDLENATVEFSDTTLELSILLMTGGTDVTSYEILKSLNGGLETIVATSPTLPISLAYSTIDEFLAGLGVSESDLRIGDVVTFRTKMIRSDGSINFAGPNEGTFSITINCSADLTGTYDVTNDSCGPSFTATISANPDGTWAITSADGGFIYYCTGNNSSLDFLNAGNITVVCGEVLPTGDLTYADNSGNNIGNIGGGSWDSVTGTLTMSHTQTFTANWAGSWNSTYVRQ